MQRARLNAQGHRSGLEQVDPEQNGGRPSKGEQDDDCTRVKEATEGLAKMKRTTSLSTRPRSGSKRHDNLDDGPHQSTYDRQSQT